MLRVGFTFVFTSWTSAGWASRLSGGSRRLCSIGVSLEKWGTSSFSYLQTKGAQCYDVPFQTRRGMNPAQHVQLLLASLSFLSPQLVALPHLLQPVLISCLLFLSHLISSSLCSSGFAFWILLLALKSYSVSLTPKVPPVLLSPKSLPSQCRGPDLCPCTAFCILPMLPTPPISPVPSSAMGALPSMGVRSLWILSAFSTHCLCLFPPPLCMGFCSMSCKPQFLFDLISPALGFSSPQPYR